MNRKSLWIVSSSTRIGNDVGVRLRQFEFCNLS